MAAEGSDRTGTGRILVVAILLTVMGGGGLWVCFGGEDRPFREAASPEPVPEPLMAGELPGFPPLELPTGALEAAWQVEVSELGELGARDEALLASWYTLQLVSAMRALERWEGDWDAVRSEHDGLVREYVRTHGVERFRHLSAPAWERFAATLFALLQRAESSEGLEPLLRNPLDPVVHAHLEAGGDFVRQGLRSGALSPSGALHVPPALLRIIFRYAWLAQIREVFPIDATLPGTELQVFLRWRLEQAEGVDVETRLRWLRDYVAMFGAQGGRPEAYWRAYLLHQAGRVGESQEVLRELRDEDAAYGAFLFESAESR